MRCQREYVDEDVRSREIRLRKENTEWKKMESRKQKRSEATRG